MVRLQRIRKKGIIDVHMATRTPKSGRMDVYDALFLVFCSLHSNINFDTVPEKKIASKTSMYSSINYPSDY